MCHLCVSSLCVGSLCVSALCVCHLCVRALSVFVIRVSAHCLCVICVSASCLCVHSVSVCVLFVNSTALHSTAQHSVVVVRLDRVVHFFLGVDMNAHIRAFGDTAFSNSFFWNSSSFTTRTIWNPSLCLEWVGMNALALRAPLFKGREIILEE